MFKGYRIAVVIPAYNEGIFIEEVIKTMPSIVDHVIVVDDCSQDDTFAKANACPDSRVIVFKTKKNQGVGGATIAGYQKALGLNSDVVVKMDGDGQMPQEYLPPLLDAIIEQGYDYADRKSVR